MLLDKKFRSELERRYTEEKRPQPSDGIMPFPPTNRFDTLLQQRHVQVRYPILQPYSICTSPCIVMQPHGLSCNHPAIKLLLKVRKITLEQCPVTFKLVFPAWQS